MLIAGVLVVSYWLPVAGGVGRHPQL